MKKYGQKSSADKGILIPYFATMQNPTEDSKDCVLFRDDILPSKGQNLIT
jgi:hypothetical protein